MFLAFVHFHIVSTNLLISSLQIFNPNY